MRKSVTIEEHSGISLQQLIDLIKNNNDGNTDIVLSLCIQGVPTEDSVITKAMFTANDDGEPGGVLNLQIKQEWQNVIDDIL